MDQFSDLVEMLFPGKTDENKAIPECPVCSTFLAFRKSIILI